MTGRRVAGGRQRKGKGCERPRDRTGVDVANWKAAWDRKTHEQCGEGPGEKAIMTSLAVYSTSCVAPASGSKWAPAFGVDRAPWFICIPCLMLQRACRH